ncbi:hypothetical protein H5T56_06435 [Candidatus Bipolaricaulota bacterium]|nr:hypothetical protein [Candidatus Bipolaricaulota bacterium]
MHKKVQFTRYFWVIGGLALGGLAGLVVGLLVFWVFPAVQKARSPVGEFANPPIVLRFLKTSQVAQDLPKLAEEMHKAWGETLKMLGLSGEKFPMPIYIYLYSSPQEMGLGISARLEEEKTLLAVTDIVVGWPVRGELGRMACTLAFGRPGNRLIPGGVVLYLDDPEHPWAEEAWTWTDRLSIQEMWVQAERLLPKDPWEDLYFSLNAPWATASLTLEKMRTVIAALSRAERGGRRVGEVLAGALVQWILEGFGSEGLWRFWQATTWEEAATALKEDPQALAQEFLTFLKTKFEAHEKKELLLALKELYSGRAARALQILSGAAGEDAEEIKGLAHLALGQVAEAFPFLADKISELEKLVHSQTLSYSRLILVGGEEGDLKWLEKAAFVLDRASLIWPDLLDFLPDRLTFYVAEAPKISTPWGVAWVRSPEEIPEVSALLALEAVSPLGLPNFSTIVNGIVLCLTQPERDFRLEAKEVLAAGRWVSLTQTLFGVYPKELAEAEAGAFVSFILERYGPEKLRAIWTALQDGASIFRATEITLGFSFYALEVELQKWVKQP